MYLYIYIVYINMEGVVGFCLNPLPPHGHIHAVAPVSFRAQLVKNPGVTSVSMTCKRKGHLMSPDISCYQVISEFFDIDLLDLLGVKSGTIEKPIVKDKPTSSWSPSLKKYFAWLRVSNGRTLHYILLLKGNPPVFDVFLKLIDPILVSPFVNDKALDLHSIAFKWCCRRASNCKNDQTCPRNNWWRLALCEQIEAGNKEMPWDNTRTSDYCIIAPLAGRHSWAVP